MLKYVQENTTKIFASSKTFANAEKFADVLTPVKFEDRYEVLGKCDVVILCSACQEPIVTKNGFEKTIALCHPERSTVCEVEGSSRAMLKLLLGNFRALNTFALMTLKKSFLKIAACA